jgi:hypothetical protein
MFVCFVHVVGRWWRLGIGNNETRIGRAVQAVGKQCVDGETKKGTNVCSRRRAGASVFDVEAREGRGQGERKIVQSSDKEDDQS